MDHEMIIKVAKKSYEMILDSIPSHQKDTILLDLKYRQNWHFESMEKIIEKMHYHQQVWYTRDFIYKFQLWIKARIRR